MLFMRQLIFGLHQFLVLEFICLLVLSELLQLPIHLLLFSLEHPELSLECRLVLALRLLYFLLDLD